MWANKMLSNTLHIANTTAKGGIIAEKDAFNNQTQAEESCARPQTKPTRRTRTNKRITLRQATSMMAAVAFARQIGTPLNAHATIHWVGTEVGDDPAGQRFAKVREGFDKWLKRQGIPGGLTAIWVRERLSGGSAEGLSTATCYSIWRTPLFAAEGAFRSRGPWSD